eukprot:jgi/Ulvmu1/9887/UM057_0043.1
MIAWSYERGNRTVLRRSANASRAQRLRGWSCHANASDEVVPDASATSSPTWPSKIGNGLTASVDDAQSLEEKETALRAELQHLKENEKGLPHRWVVVIAMIAAFVLCNMDKVNMSVAIIPMANELGWSTTERGLVSAAFFWGYAATQIPAGYIATRIGGAKVLLLGVMVWSIGTLVAPPLAQMGLVSLCVSRAIVGLGEGFAPSAVTHVMASIVPQSERSRAVAYVFGGLDLGSVIGLLLCGPLIAMYGWPSVFYVFAIIGLGWAVIWPLSKPGVVDDVVAKEKQLDDVTGEIQRRNAAKKSGTAFVERTTEELDDVRKVPYGKFLKDPAVWAVITAHFCFNWGYYTLLAWLPSYFDLALGLQVSKSSILTLVPYLAMVCMTPFVGPTADAMIAGGMPVTRVRKLCQGLSLLGPALCMIVLAALTPYGGAAAAAAAGGLDRALVWGLVACLSVAFALSAWARAGLYCNHQDMSPKYASALLGISNTAGALPGVLGVTLAGILLDQTNNWATAVFLPIAAVQLFGTLIYSIFGSSERRLDW